MRTPIFAIGIVFATTLVNLRAADPAKPTEKPTEKPTDAGIAAKVNGVPIHLADVDAALRANLANVPLTPSQLRQLRITVLDDLIEDQLLEQFLDKSGTKLDAAEIEAQMKALHARLIKENLTIAAYLKETGRTEAQMRAQWARENRLFNHVRKVVTDEQLKLYHAANRDHFDQVEVRVSHILARVSRTQPPAERLAARERLQGIRGEIAAAKCDFTTAARKHSQCTTAKTGGDLGFIYRRGLPEDEPLARVAFALKVGELSDIIETDFGYHLITITERKAGTPSEWEKCVFEVLEAYAEDYRVELIKQLRKDAQITITVP